MQWQYDAYLCDEHLKMHELMATISNLNLEVIN